jgi:hypothetical protein
MTIYTLVPCAGAIMKTMLGSIVFGWRMTGTYRVRYPLIYFHTVWFVAIDTGHSCCIHFTLQE